MISDLLDSNFATGVVGLIGVVLGLVLDRWSRRWGAVRCDTDWQVERGAGSVDSPGGAEVHEQRLRVTFRNKKDLPVSVLKMEVLFYREGKPLEEWARPEEKVLDERGEASPPESIVNLPSHVAVQRTISVAPDHDNPFKRKMMEEAEKAQFVVTIAGAGDIRRELTPPWKHGG